jgi:hypothetical protein
VETLSYLYHATDVNGIIVETSDASAPPMPTFYLGNKQVPIYYMTYGMSLDSLKNSFVSRVTPNYVIFLKQEHLNDRIQRMDSLTPNLAYVSKIVPSIADQLLYFMNPKHNVNQTSYIYKTPQ